MTRTKSQSIKLKEGKQEEALHDQVKAIAKLRKPKHPGKYPTFSMNQVPSKEKKIHRSSYWLMTAEGEMHTDAQKEQISNYWPSGSTTMREDLMQNVELNHSAKIKDYHGKKGFAAIIKGKGSVTNKRNIRKLGIQKPKGLKRDQTKIQKILGVSKKKK
jgi:hypothetical protein